MLTRAQSITTMASQRTMALRRAAGELGSALGRLRMMQQRHQHPLRTRQDALEHPHFSRPLRAARAARLKRMQTAAMASSNYVDASASMQRCHAGAVP